MRTSQKTPETVTTIEIDLARTRSTDKRGAVVVIVAVGSTTTAGANAVFALLIPPAFGEETPRSPYSLREVRGPYNPTINPADVNAGPLKLMGFSTDYVPKPRWAKRALASQKKC
jgi:hypothetical protein